MSKIQRCQFCSRPCNIRNIRVHERFCVKNPNRKIFRHEDPAESTSEIYTEIALTHCKDEDTHWDEQEVIGFRGRDLLIFRLVSQSGRYIGFGRTLYEATLNMRLNALADLDMSYIRNSKNWKDYSDWE